MNEKVSFYRNKLINTSEIEQIIQEKFEYELVDENPNIVFCLGGDGTFLDAVAKFGTSPLYIPINLGSLGFYCSWGKDDIDNLIKDYNENCIMKAMLLDVELIYSNRIEVYNCINEVTITNNINTQILEVAINGQEIEHFRGTGICVSTPTGSTAYNKSLGGAIISSSKKLFQLSHIATINNVIYRSVENSIILDETEILNLEGDFRNSIISIDRKTHTLEEVKCVNVKISDKSISLLVPKNNNFYTRLKKAFIAN